VKIETTEDGNILIMDPELMQGLQIGEHTLTLIAVNQKGTKKNFDFKFMVKDFIPF
jgi:hypothetical protein